MLQAARMAYSGSELSGEKRQEMGHFLASLKEALDSERITEGDAARLLQRQLTGQAEQALAILQPAAKEVCPKIIRWALKACCAERDLEQAKRLFHLRAQQPSEAEKQFVDAISDLARRCSSAVTEREKIAQCACHLQPPARGHALNSLTPGATLPEVVKAAATLGDHTRKEQWLQAPNKLAPRSRDANESPLIAQGIVKLCIEAGLLIVRAAFIVCKNAAFSALSETGFIIADSTGIREKRKGKS